MARVPRNLPGVDAAPPPPDRPLRQAAPRLPNRTVTLASSAGLDELARWAASERVDEAARSRAAQRRCGAAEASEATVAGLLARRAEDSRPVLIDTASGDRLRGRVLTAGADFCIIASPSGQVMVPTAVIAAISEAPGRGASGDRPGPDPFLFGAEAPGSALGEALAALAAERPLVKVAAGGRHWRGRLTAAGADIVSVAAEPGAADAATSHIAVAAIDHLVILDR